MILVLIRHGKTIANEKHLYCGKTDIELSDNGIIDIKKRCNLSKNIDFKNMRIISSGMKRCEQTISLYFGDINHETDSAFSELDFGKFEMHSYEELKNDSEYISWISGDNERNVPPGGESGASMKLRVLNGVKSLIKEEKDTVLVTHGGVIHIIMKYFFPNENKNRYQWQPEFGEGYVINTSRCEYEVLK